MKSATVNINDCLGQFRVSVRLVGMHRFRLRMVVGAALVRLAVWIMGAQYEG